MDVDQALNIEELRVHRELEKEKVFKDDFVHVKVIIENTGKNSFDFIEIRDYFNPQLFRLILGENFISTRINPKDTIKFSYVLEPKVRGEVAVSDTPKVWPAVMVAATSDTLTVTVSEVVLVPSSTSTVNV